MNFWDEFVYAVGVDPGLTKTGLVVLNEHGILHTATYASYSGDVLGRRLAEMTDALIYKAWGICLPDGNKTMFAVEQAFIGKSAQTAIKQIKLIGCLEAGANKNSLDRGAYYAVSPSELKLALAGYGQAKKSEETTDADGNVYPSLVDAMQVYPGAPLGLTKASREAVADALGAALAGIAQWEKDNQ